MTQSLETKNNPRTNGNMIAQRGSLDSSSSSSSSTSSSTPSKQETAQTSKLPPTALTFVNAEGVTPHPPTIHSKSLDSSLPEANEDKSIKNLNRKYESVYIALKKPDSMTQTNSSEGVDDLRSTLKAQITI